MVSSHTHVFVSIFRISIQFLFNVFYFAYVCRVPVRACAHERVSAGGQKPQSPREVVSGWVLMARADQREQCVLLISDHLRPLPTFLNQKPECHP